MLKKQAFTLVELIVVITILSILSAIAFLSFQGYSSSARDSSRLADLSNLTKALELTTSRWGTLPQPANPIILTVGATTIGYQGYADKAILGMIGMSDSKDPLDAIYYTYSTNATQTKYQVLGYLESADSLAYSPVGQAYAEPASYSGRTVVTKGQTLGIILESSTQLPLQSKLTANSSFDTTNGATNSGYTAQFTNTKKFVSTNATPLISTLSAYQPKALLSYDTDLVGYWDFNDTYSSGGQLYVRDLTANGNDWLLRWSGGHLPSLSSNSARGSKSLTFDGIWDWVQITNKSAMSFTGGVTFLAFANSSAWAGPFILSQNGPYFVRMSSARFGSAAYELYDSTLPGWRGVSSYKITPALNTWYATGLVYHAGKWEIQNYVNGALDGTWAITPGLTLTVSCLAVWTAWNSGCSAAPNQGYFQWNIDEIQVYRRALSASEIQAIYDAVK